MNKYVFDMGGVITRGYYLRGLYEELKPTISYTEFKYQFYCSQEAIDAYKGLITIDEFFTKITSHAMVKFSKEELTKLYYAYKGGLYQKTILIMQYLKERGNQIYLLSNLNQADHQYLEKNMDMNIFDQEFLSYKMHKVKPEPEIYNDVINELGTNDFFFFDDSSTNINAAKELGIKAYKTTGHDINDTMKLINKPIK